MPSLEFIRGLAGFKEMMTTTYSKIRQILNQLLVVAFVSVCAPAAWSQVGTYQSVEEFLAESFPLSPSSSSPRSFSLSNETLWLNDEIRAELSDVLDRQYRGLRIRYWRVGNRTAWIFNEIGKEQPITSGIAVEDNKIVLVSVLEYRESRGGEVRMPSFRRQYVDASLATSNKPSSRSKVKLDKRVQGITGATLSVRTLNRSAVAALKLHAIALANEIGNKSPTPISQKLNAGADKSLSQISK